MDRITKQHRSWNMSRIRGSDTKPELIVRSALHKMGFRFRIRRTDLPGKPDIVLPKYRTVIFVNGCFWHRHKGCNFAYTPKTKRSFWLKKFENTVKRDQIVAQQLKCLRWHRIVIWECQLHKHTIARIGSKLKRSQAHKR